MQFSKTTMPPFYTAGTVQSRFEEHDGQFEHLLGPAKSPDLNIIKPLWSILETSVRNRFSSPTSLQQLEDVLLEEWYKIPLESVKNSYESVRRRTAALLKAKMVQHHINIEMCTISVVFALFCPTPVYNIYIYIYREREVYKANDSISVIIR
jgi:hypothetical protein